LTVISQLDPAQFYRYETLLASQENLSASLFRYPKDVFALQLMNVLCEFITLLFQRKQIWGAIWVEGDLAQTMQIHPGGSANLVRYQTDQFDDAICWYCRSQDQDVIGIEPCTAELDGFSTEKNQRKHPISLWGREIYNRTRSGGFMSR